MSPAAHPADSHDVIRVHGAKENNLLSVDVTIPKRRVTVFTGVSGSGKSSLVFDTIAAESQRLINETYPAFVQGFMPNLARPHVDALEGLTTAIVVGQERMGSNARSTVGTATDAHALLRVLFSQVGEPHIGPPAAFSFNVPSVVAVGERTVDKATSGRPAAAEQVSFSRSGGMCPRCSGMGHVSDVNIDELIDASLSLAQGAIRVPGYTPDGWYVRVFSAVVPMETPIRDFTEAQREDFLYGASRKVKIDNMNLTYEGLVPKIQKSMLSKDVDSLQPHLKAFVERAVAFATCPECEGTRLAAPARSSFVNGKSIADVCACEVSQLPAWLDGIEAPALAPLLGGLRELVDAFVDVGLGYLSLDRATGTLSGGEAQRTKLVKHLGSALTDVTYIFDEPTVGLHPHDVGKVNELLLQLRDKGNTVLVVEHKPETIRIADHVIDMGPGAGSGGGSIVFAGSVSELESADTPTGRHLADRATLKDTTRTPRGSLSVRGASTHNLKSVDVDIPLGILVAITGVAGSGKSSLIHGSVAGLDGVVVIDQTPIRGSRRSNPATYTGALESVRKAFAKANGVKPALFSANSEGACPVCNGAGVIVTELGPMATVETQCEECEGRRFNQDVLTMTLAGKSIADVLDLSVDDAVGYLADSGAEVRPALAVVSRLARVGLGYVKLGQPLSTLSGGERQRLKLAQQLGEPGSIYVLDEPTTGLHLQDVARLLALLDDLVDSGTSLLVIEHHQAVMAHADWIIDLGPGAGHEGGSIVFEGTPREAVAMRAGLTGEHLAQYVAG